jgi:L-2,4-diaminobutyrate decarboxylase
VAGYTAGVHRAAAVLADRVRAVRRPYSGAGVADLAALVDAVDLDRPLGDLDAALDEVARMYLDHAVWFHEPAYVAHLNCPVAIPALSAEVLLSAVNSSVDTWDQSTTGTLIERRLVDWTAGRIGFGPAADGVFTSGGTQSNLHGLLLAREDVRSALDPDGGGRSDALPLLRVLATAESHFSVAKAASLLGLPPGAVVAVPTDGAGRMDPAALARTVDDLRHDGLVPMAVVATAGTTDLGRIDPLDAVGAVCEHRGVWLHVDAAYGCGLLVSARRRHLLDGIERADSVTVDFHKSFFQPVSCSALVVRRAETMRRVAVHAAYLNPRAATVPNQVDKSLQTTRRLDALKLWMTLRTVGAPHLGELFDRVVDLADDAYRCLRADPDFEVAAAPTLSTVLFRYRPPGVDAATSDRLVPAVRERLFASGAAVVAGTRLGGHHWLKFTLLNPDTTVADVRAVLDLIRAAARDVLAGADARVPVEAGR